MILLSHPTGNEFVREAARALNEAELLSEFWTCICWNKEHLLNHVLPRSVRNELGRRAFPHVSRHQLHCYPWTELGRLVARKLNLAGLSRHEVGLFSVDAVYRNLDSRVAARVKDAAHIRAVYAYEDGALASFRAARRVGMTTIYELPIGYWKCYRELMNEETSLQPEWAATLQGKGDSDDKLWRKDEELALASHIVVPSEFVRRTLLKAGPLEATISVVPYGAPLAQREVRTEMSARDGKLRVLFVGSLSQRKGLSYLLAAVARLKSRVELTLIGRKMHECPALDAALREHRWIPSLSHEAVLEQMSGHDVMVFPSLFEGCALVVLEAMSQGVPVIATPNTGSGDFISSGEDGFVVPIRDVEAIVEKLEILIGDRDRLTEMSRAARRTAAQHSWEQYRRRLAATVHLALGHETVQRSEGASVPTYSRMGTC